MQTGPLPTAVVCGGLGFPRAKTRELQRGDAQGDRALRAAWVRGMGEMLRDEPVVGEEGQGTAL